MTAHYLMVGGFLGAGKTTALLRAGQYLGGQGKRVGLIMNDQSESLVDTALARAQSFPVEEIAGGCFCCRFNSLVDAAARLTRDAQPDVFLAEPVGSCTDLSATVVIPLRQMFGDRFRVAPLSVLVDPDRALRVLGLEPGRSFSAKVLYVYSKQLEEADVLVINKIDALPDDRRQVLREALEARYPSAGVLEISARTGEGVGQWIDLLISGRSGGRVLDIDYDLYAEGEALLGWLNCTAAFTGTGVDADQFLMGLAGGIHGELASADVEVAHLKLTLVPLALGGIAVVNATRTDAAPTLAFALDATVDEAEITVNVRAECDPERLERAVRQVVARTNQGGSTSVIIEHLECFRPGRPVPTHRLGATVS